MNAFTLFGYEFSVLDLFVFALAVGYGFYALYTAIRLVKKPEFFDNKLLMPANDVTAKDCTDPEGYFKFLTPRMFVFSIGLIVFGLFDALFPIVVTHNNWPYVVALLGLVPVMSLLIWYGVEMHRASVEFFS